MVPDEGPARFTGFPELRRYEKQRLEDIIANHLEIIEGLKKARGTDRREAKRLIQTRESAIKFYRALIELIDKGQNQSLPEKKGDA